LSDTGGLAKYLALSDCYIAAQNDWYRFIFFLDHFLISSPYSITHSFHSFKVPTMGDSITEGTIVDIPVAPGDYVSEDDVVLVLETDKVSVDVRAPEGGCVVEILGEVDDVVEVGSALYRLDTDGVKPAEGGGGSSSDAASPVAPAVETPAATPVAATPPAAAPPSTPPPEKKATPPPTPQLPQMESITTNLGNRPERRSKMSRMRQRVATRLKESQNTAAMLTTFQEVDMGNFMEMRHRHKDDFAKKHGVKLGFMSVFVKACTSALQEVPAINAYIDDEAKEIVYRDYCDISVAVASPNGLVVPVLRNTEFMTFADVERTIALFGQKAKDGTLAIDDMAGGTFTISNGGVFGSLMGTPIINQPQSAILGMHATKMRAVVDEKGNVVARPMMYLALTYDHRLIDGREGVTFLKSVADKITDPARLVFDI
jgi:2-oxoglutarate dehydrogenase E2 component (dihydrolipoamide succinyltransferase)